MADPVLKTHEVVPRLFLLSGPSPISIRDQFIRAKLLVDRLDATKRLAQSRETQYCAVVVGGGGSGVSAALAVAGKGERTLLAEREANLFPVQRAAATRRVCATQYLWPLDDFDAGVFPTLDEQDLPLKVIAANGRRPLTGRALARDWIAACGQVRKRLPLDIQRGKEAVRIIVDPGGAFLWVEFADGSSVSTDLVIWAAGFGKERVSVPGVAGLPFWGRDDLEQLGTTSSQTILIAGGGDGGLQDLLRIVTGLGMARDMLVALSVPDQCRRMVASVEDRVWRARTWNENDGMVPYLREAEKQCEAAATVALADTDCVDAMETLLRARHPQTVALAYGDPLPTPYYPLNRFLAVLLRRFLKGNPAFGSITHYPGLKLLRVAPSGVRHAPIFDTSAPAGMPPDFDRIIVRFGPLGNAPTLGPAGSSVQLKAADLPLRWPGLPAHLPL